MGRKNEFAFYRTLSHNEQIEALEFEREQLQGKQDKASRVRLVRISQEMGVVKGLKTLVAKQQRIKRIAEAFEKL